MHLAGIPTAFGLAQSNVFCDEQSARAGANGGTFNHEQKLKDSEEKFRQISSRAATCGVTTSHRHDPRGHTNS